jgi:hypothetical protein
MNEATWAYVLFGLAVRSNLPIPGLTPCSRPSEITDVALFFGITPGDFKPIGDEAEQLHYTSSYTDESGEPALRIWRQPDGRSLRFAYSDGHEFWIDGGLGKVWAQWPRHSSIEQVTPYILGPIFGVLLRQRGVTCLHASAAANGGEAVAFVGGAGAGKSTIAAALVLRGWTALADDITALEERNGRFYAAPAYPALNLWPDSVCLLHGSDDALPTVFPSWEKRRMQLTGDGHSFASEALPLIAVYLLGEPCSDDEFEVEGVEGQAAFVALVANTYANNTISPQIRAREFSVLGHLVSSVPVRRLAAKRGQIDLDRFSQLVAEDVEQLVSRRSLRLLPTAATSYCKTLSNG